MVEDPDLSEGDEVHVSVRPSIARTRRSEMEILEGSPASRVSIKRRKWTNTSGRSESLGTDELTGNGAVYLDACVFICSVERVESYITLMGPMRTRV